MVRYDFVNLGRQGDYIDYTYHKHFSKPFDWLAFNLALVEEQASEELIINLRAPYRRHSWPQREFPG